MELVQEEERHPEDTGELGRAGAMGKLYMFGNSGWRPIGLN